MPETRPCFISVSVEDDYLRIEYQSPLGDIDDVAHCISIWSTLCRDQQRSFLMLVRRPNGMYPYSIEELRRLSDVYKRWFRGLAIAFVDPAVNLNSIFVSAVNRGNEVMMVFFKDEPSAIRWIESAQGG